MPQYSFAQRSLLNRKMMSTRTPHLTSLLLIDAFILTLLCLTTEASPTQPSNVALTAGSRTTLHCASGVAFTTASWSFVASGSTTAPVLITFSQFDCKQSIIYPQYQFNDTDIANGQCDLIIENVTTNEAGWYQCNISISVGSSYDYAAQMTVFYSSPNCSQNVTNNVAVGDYVSMECAVSYSSDGVNATMTWSGCQYHNLSTHTRTAGTITTTVSEIYVVAQQPYLEICLCNTTTGNQLPSPPPALASYNLSSAIESFSYAWVSGNDIQVQHCPFNVTMFPPTNSILPQNSDVTCQSDGYPAPAFYELSAVLELVDSRATLTVFNSSSLTLSGEGIYNVTCKATNFITSAQQGIFACTNQSLTYLYNVSSSETYTTAPPSTTSEHETTYISVTTSYSHNQGGTGTTGIHLTPEPSSSCVITSVVAVFVVLGIEIVIAAVSTLVVCRYKSGCLIYKKTYGNKDTTAQQSLNEIQNEMGNEDRDYMKLQLTPTTQLHPEMALHSQGYYTQDPPIMPAVDTANAVYTELQPQPQAENGDGSRQPLQFQTDIIYANSPPERSPDHKHGPRDASAETNV